MKRPVGASLKRFLRQMGALPYVIIIMGVIIQLINSNFLTQTNLLNVLRQNSIIAVAAFGMTALIISGGIDLSLGSIIGLSCVIASSLMKETNSVFVGLIAAMLLGCIAGAVNGVFVVVSGVHPFVVTLGTLTIYRGLGLIFTGGLQIPDLPKEFLDMASNNFLIMPILVWISIIVFFVMRFLLYKTKFGLYMYEIGGREEAALVAGINVKKYKVMVYALSGLLSGLAGMMLTARVISAQATLGAGYHLQVIAAAVIGGTSLGGGKGKIGGTVLGILILGILSNGLNLLRVSTFWQSVAIGTTIVIAVILDVISQKKAAKRGEGIG